MPWFPGKDEQVCVLGRELWGNWMCASWEGCPATPGGSAPRVGRGGGEGAISEGRGYGGAFLPLPPFPPRWWKVGSERKCGAKGRKRRRRTRHPRSSVAFGVLRRQQCASFSAREGAYLGDSRTLAGCPSPFPAVSRSERSHCPSQTVKKLLEEQRRRQQQPDAGGASGQFLPPLAQPLTPSVNEGEVGHTHFLGHQEAVGSGLGGLAAPTGLLDWDPSAHAAYADSPHTYPASAAEGFLASDFYPPSDPGRQCPFPQAMEAPLDTRLYAEPSLPQVGTWRGSGLPSGPPQLPPVATGPSLDTARAHMLTLGPQQLLAQDEEGDTLLHLFAARGLRWAAYAAAEMLQACRHLDIREHKGKTPLLVAAAANQPLIVEDLLNLGAEPNATDHQGRSLLHVAATYGLPEVLLAVFNSGVQVNLEARDFEGLTPLHTAILAFNAAMRPLDLCPRVLSAQARDRLACVHMLLQMGADHTSQEIKSNKTVLHLAVQAANPTLVQLLLDLPRGDLRAFVNMKAHGNTALHMAAALPPGPPQEAIVRRLLAAGADPTLRNLENEQPVHLLRPGPGPEGVPGPGIEPETLYVGSRH
ncbi:NF-kappa-B inhibitor delta isoform X1 [Dasypus novemcinctus]|uniref:NF-kappa-B inhibitor delta isoform X1 n=1 Tax=Dasypus novemcinctus TaxID=9361 RepID=UPI00265E10A2|nr:NF-kappa-B inhibitor delta isoform X2 [Dasypus novemcinctus]